MASSRLFRSLASKYALPTAAALLVLLGFGRCDDFHICDAGTHREYKTGFSRDERWCATGTGERHGLYTSWHAWGEENIELEGAFEQGHRMGTWRRWDDSLGLRWEGEYRDDLPIGLWTFYHPNGERWKRGAIRSGERDGLWTFWDRYGKVSTQVTFEAGKFVGETTTTPEFLPTELRELSGVRFSFPLACGGSPYVPIVVGNLVIVACKFNDRAGVSGPSQVYGIDVQTGREVWRRDFPPVKISSPWSDGNQVYLQVGQEFLALDVATGRLGESFGLKEKANAFSTAVRDGDTIFFSTYDGGIYALDQDTNSLRWRYPTIKTGANSPLVLSNGTLLARMPKGAGLRAIDASTGEERWSFGSKGSGRGSVATDGSTVYFGSKDNHLYALDLATGQPRWSFEAGSWIQATPAIGGSLVFVGSGDTNLYAIDRETGRERWRFKTRSMIEHAVRVVGDTVLVRSRDGRIFALDRESGNELWRFDTKTPWGSAPTPGPDVVVFVSSDGFLTVLE